MTDNLTGLVWLKDANCIKTQYPGFDNDGTAGDGGVTWQHALDFVAGVNAGSYPDCGANQTDWRLSNRKEFLSLHDFSQDSPILPAGHPFTDALLDFYWSSTSNSSSTGAAWRASLEEGFMFSDFKDSFDYVWPVRAGIVGGQPQFSIFLPAVLRNH